MILALMLFLIGLINVIGGLFRKIEKKIWKMPIFYATIVASFLVITIFSWFYTNNWELNQPAYWLSTIVATILAVLMNVTAQKLPKLTRGDKSGQHSWMKDRNFWYLALWAILLSTGIALIGASSLLDDSSSWASIIVRNLLLDKSGYLMTLLGSIGLVALLTTPANYACKALIGVRNNGSINEKQRKNELPGGSIIGPLERLLMIFLGLAGAITLIAVIIGAKGIIRFPEISNDKEGEKAEEFLIGSLTSWLIAFWAFAMFQLLAPGL